MHRVNRRVVVRVGVVGGCVGGCGGHVAVDGVVLNAAREGRGKLERCKEGIESVTTQQISHCVLSFIGSGGRCTEMPGIVHI